MLQTGERTLAIAGDLTMRGSSRPVQLAVEIVGAKTHPLNKRPAFGVAAHGKLDRSAWGIQELLPDIVDDTVHFEINAEFGT